MKNWFNSFILCTQPFLLPLIFDGSIVLCWLPFYLNNILLFLESPMVNCFFNIHSPFFLTNKPTFVGSSNVSSKKNKELHFLVFLMTKTIMSPGSGQWGVSRSCGVGLQENAFTKGLIQQEKFSCSSPLLFRLTWSTDKMAGAAAAIMWPWENLEGR